MTKSSASCSKSARSAKNSYPRASSSCLTPEYRGRADDYIDLVCHEIIPLVAEEKLATSVDVFCESLV